MITDRDICMCALCEDGKLSELRVRDALSNRAGKVLSCQRSDSVERAQALMLEGQVRRLPVVDDQGSLAGIVSLADLARTAMSESGHSEPAVTKEQVNDLLGAICSPRGQPLPAWKSVARPILV